MIEPAQSTVTVEKMSPSDLQSPQLPDPRISQIARIAQIHFFSAFAVDFAKLHQRADQPEHDHRDQIPLVAGSGSSGYTRYTLRAAASRPRAAHQRRPADDRGLRAAERRATMIT